MSRFVWCLFYITEDDWRILRNGSPDFCFGGKKRQPQKEVSCNKDKKMERSCSLVGLITYFIRLGNASSIPQGQSLMAAGEKGLEIPGKKKKIKQTWVGELIQNNGRKSCRYLKDFSTRLLVAWKPKKGNQPVPTALSSKGCPLLHVADDQIPSNSGKRALPKFHFACLPRGYHHGVKLLLTDLLRLKDLDFTLLETIGCPSSAPANHSLNSTFSTSHLKAFKIVFCFVIIIICFY